MVPWDRYTYSQIRETNPTSSDSNRWHKLRADYLTASKTATDLEIALRVRYGNNGVHWASKSEKKRLETVKARKDRIGSKMFEILERVSPRHWGSGVPAYWLYEKLSWEDAVRPLHEPLSVTPPLAYGATEPMR
jgi:hypothetical protein